VALTVSDLKSNATKMASVADKFFRWFSGYENGNEDYETKLDKESIQYVLLLDCGTP
jgi:hypothetical protein